MSNKIKQVRTRLPLLITIKFEDNTTKFYDLTHAPGLEATVKILAENPNTYLQPSINPSATKVEWKLGKNTISINGDLVYSLGTDLQKYDDEKELFYHELLFEHQNDYYPNYGDYMFKAPFNIRVALYINRYLEDDVKKCYDSYQKMLDKYPNLQSIGIFEDECNIENPYSLDMPGLTQLMHHCLDGEVDVIVTRTIFRFANTMTATFELERKLYERGVAIYFADPGIITSDPAFEAYMQIHRELSSDRSLPQVLLGEETILRVFEPDTKNPYKEIEKYLSMPYVMAVQPIPEDGTYIASLPELGNCCAKGTSIASAITNLKKQQADWLVGMWTSGVDIPLPKAYTPETSEEVAQ